MISSKFRIQNLGASLAVVVYCLVIAVNLSNGQQAIGSVDGIGGLGGLIGGMSHAVNDLTGSALTGGAGALNVNLPANTASGAANMAAAAAAGQSQSGLFGGMLPNVLNSANNMVGGVTRPVMGMLGSLTGGAGGPLAALAGNNVVGDTMRMATGALNGLASGMTGGVSFPGAAGGGGLFGAGAGGLHNAYKREAVASNMMSAATAGSSSQAAAETGAIEAGAHYGAAASSAAAAANGLGVGGGYSGVNGGGYGAFNAGVGSAEHAAAAAGHMAAAQAAAANAVGSAGALESAVATNNLVGGSSVGQSSPIVAAANSQIAAGRAGLAGEALRNAQAESALAGADMVAHGANNARSASLASNAYRQAKLASARDRVNIAGTIQNSARISDAAIATHDAATKAEDSLMGSELAVDSASTVLDSDGAYIPPVTSSLLRSLPYGRLGVRNVIPKPLTYPSVLLPDVWLNGVPVNYLNVPMRMLPYTIGSTAQTNPLWSSGQSLANGQIINGQPFIANNGMLLNGMVVDPAVAYMSSGMAAAAGGASGLASSSIVPVLANGQLEAQDEVAAANQITMQQLGGAGMSGTYQGYGRLNPVPMITGSVSDVNLLPTTTVGTTYPIGSALVIEPRDSFFQDYVDNASSRQNFDEREQ